MELTYKILIIYFTVLNILAFLLCAADKLLAIHGCWRISEKALFTVSILGGSFGMLLGMYLMRHKTKHKKFTIGIPLILFLQCVAVFVIFFK